jgi:hypothetical protein
MNLRPEAIEKILTSQIDRATEVLGRFEKLLDAIEEQLESESAPDDRRPRIIQGVLSDKEIRVRDDLTETTESKKFSLLPKRIRDRYDKLMSRFNEIRGHPLLMDVPPQLGKNLQDFRNEKRTRQPQEPQDELPRISPPLDPGASTLKRGGRRP